MAGARALCTRIRTPHPAPSPFPSYTSTTFTNKHKFKKHTQIFTKKLQILLISSPLKNKYLLWQAREHGVRGSQSGIRLVRRGYHARACMSYVCVRVYMCVCVCVCMCVSVCAYTVALELSQPRKWQVKLAGSEPADTYTYKDTYEDTSRHVSTYVRAHVWTHVRTHAG